MKITKAHNVKFREFHPQKQIKGTNLICSMDELLLRTIYK